MGVVLVPLNPPSTAFTSFVSPPPLNASPSEYTLEIANVSLLRVSKKNDLPFDLPVRFLQMLIE